jgi:hypothetical protein
MTNATKARTSTRRAGTELERAARRDRRARTETARAARRARVERLLRREVLGMPLRVPAVALLAAAAMLPVGLFLSGAGVLVLQVSGGAATDTSLVVMVAAFCVTDFWGGSLLHALTKRSSREVAVVWLCARAVVLLVVVLAAHGFAVAAPVAFVLAAPAAWLGAQVGAKQAALRAATLDSARRSGPATADAA